MCLHGPRAHFCFYRIIRYHALRPRQMSRSLFFRPSWGASWLLRALASVVNASVNIHTQGLCRHKFSTHLSTNQRAWSPDHTAHVRMSSFVRNGQSVPRVAVPFCIPTRPSKGSCCSLASPAFAVSVLNFPNSNRCTAGSLWCFNLQLPQGIQDVENLFTRLCAICMTSLVRYPFRYFAHFLH